MTNDLAYKTLDPRIMPFILCCLKISEANGGGMAVEVEPSCQYSFFFFFFFALLQIAAGNMVPDTEANLSLNSFTSY